MPERVKQYELEALFSPVPGTVAVVTMNSKYGGIAREGEKVAAGFLLMTSVQTAKGLMESEWKCNAYCRDRRMVLEYANSRLESSMIHKVFPHGKYWICSACHVDNAPRRDVCVSCSSLRSIGCAFVDPTVPTRMLRITDIDQSTTTLEKDIEKAIRDICAVQDVKFSKDRKTGHHKGTAYCHCFSIQDAIKISDALSKRTFGDSGQLCGVEYCMERFPADKSEPIQPNNKVTEESTWEPAEFQTRQGTTSRLDTSGNRHEQNDVFVYDATSGYHWHSIDHVWGTKDPITGTFVPYVEPESNPRPVQQDTRTEGHVSTAAVVTAKPAITVASQQKEIKAIQGVIHVGKWAQKKKQKQ